MSIERCLTSSHMSCSVSRTVSPSRFRIESLKLCISSTTALRRLCNSGLNSVLCLIVVEACAIIEWSTANAWSFLRDEQSRNSRNPFVIDRILLSKARSGVVLRLLVKVGVTMRTPPSFTVSSLPRLNFEAIIELCNNGCDGISSPMTSTITHLKSPTLIAPSGISQA